MKLDFTKIDLKKRFSNKSFLVAFIAACVLLLQQLGLGRYLPVNLSEIVNTLLTILCMLGIVIDPTTDGIADSEMVQQGISSNDLLQEMTELKEEIEELKAQLEKENI